MDGADGQAAKRVALLFTQFPVATETFLQREVIALQRCQRDWPVFALWPTSEGGVESMTATHTFHRWHLLSLFWWIPYWTIRNPKGMRSLAEVLVSARVPNFINFSETLLGFAYGIARARTLAGRFDHFHAVWASAPATAAWVLYKLTGIPYSMAGHAYDLYEDGGDGLLETKIPEARFIRTSTDTGRDRWKQLGSPSDTIHVIRRGLLKFPKLDPAPAAAPEEPYQLLAVGRLVEKMGYSVLLQILARLKRSGLPFRATIVGSGPLMGSLQRRAKRLDLEDYLEFTGGLPFHEVTWYYREADLFLFSGQVAQSGDRAGFPNAIGEAMAWGVPVCASSVGAVQEGVHDGQTGLLYTDPDEAVEKISQLFSDPARYAAIRQSARQWAEEEFDACRNMERFARLVEAACP
ncbi:MAG: glycosyltransferase family 4 protein [Puniceicoccaceae bacterium]